MCDCIEIRALIIISTRRLGFSTSVVTAAGLQPLFVVVVPSSEVGSRTATTRRTRRFWIAVFAPKTRRSRHALHAHSSVRFVFTVPTVGIHLRTFSDLKTDPNEYFDRRPNNGLVIDAGEREERHRFCSSRVSFNNSRCYDDDNNIKTVIIITTLMTTGVA